MFRNIALQTNPEPIGFLLIPKFSSMAFFSAIEPLRVANRLAGRPLFAWHPLSVDGGPVEASNGMRLMVDGKLEDAESLPTLIICAGFDPWQFETRAILSMLRRLHRRGVVLGALDTGAHMLAKAGLLGDFPVTMHWEAVPAFIEEFPDIAVSAELFEIHHDIFTCAGGTAALDMMLYMIAGKHGMKLALAVSEQFIHDRIRNADDQQRIALPTRLRSNNRKVLAIVEAMERSMEQPLAPRDLAAMAAVSVRQMERLFRQVMGCSPSEHYRRLRLERARSLLLQTDMAVIDIAMATGFSSASIFSRSYSAHFGVSPRADRRKPDYLGAEGESIIEAPMRQTMSLPFNSDG